MALIDNLISYWKMDEASGNRADSHGSNTLVDVNTVGSATGKINSGADFERDNNESFTVADNASLSVTGDFSISVWLNFESTPGAGAYWIICDKFVSPSDMSYTILYTNNGGDLRTQVRISSNGSAATTKEISHVMNTATWYHYVFCYTASSGGGQVYVNASSVGTMTGFPTSIYDGTATFRIGDGDASFFGSGEFDGIMDEFGFWGKVLSGAEVTELYNSGNGLEYPFGTTFQPRPPAAMGGFMMY